MITIVTGKTKSGKTSKLKEMYESNHIGDGFIFERVNKDNKLYGYEAVRLSNNARYPVKILSDYYAFEGMYDQEYSIYRYSKTAYQDILMDIKHMVKDKVSPIYLDDINDLELLKKGNDEAFLHLLKSHVDIVISCKDTNVRKIINHYRLSDYKIIGLKK